MAKRNPNVRQLLYDRIRESSKDEVILEDMVRMGFWGTRESSGSAQGLPDDPAEELRRINELERKLRALAEQGHRLRDLDRAKAELLKQRLAKSRQQRVETKERREAQRRERAEAWAERKRTDIVYLGEGVSSALSQRQGQAKHGLPELHDAAAIAAAMGVSVGMLRFLAFHRKVSATHHWRRFQIPKKTGGVRTISAPMPKLKAAQHWVLRNILEPIPVHDAAHGFVRGRSIVTNAAAHVGRDVVVNMDLKDFFPTLTWVRVRGLFRSLGFSPAASTTLGLLCTEAEVDEVEIDGRRWYVHRSERHLPQGSPCSPAITNLVCVRLDQRLSGLARSLGYTYTRYADDLTFSGPPNNVKTLLGAVRAIVGDEGFRVHPKKTRIMRKGGRQEVTGLVVNRRLGVSRHLYRRWRAVLFQVRRDGPEGKTFGHGKDVIASLIGFASFVKMVEPDKGAAMLASAREVAAERGWTQARRATFAPSDPAEPASPDPTPADPAAAGHRSQWWQFWKWFG